MPQAMHICPFYPSFLDMTAEDVLEVPNINRHPLFCADDEIHLVEIGTA